MQAIFFLFALIFHISNWYPAAMFSNPALWALPIISSALILGFYNVCIKQSVKENSVVPVLFLATACGSLFYVLLMLCSGELMNCIRCTPREFGLIWIKSLIVAMSWGFGYYAMRELPISIAVPIRATAPLWTFLGAVLFFHEIPSWFQGLGMLIVFCGYYGFSVLGQKEGISFRKHKGIHTVALATLFGAASGVYDKYLLGVLQIPKGTVQFYFAVELVILFGIALLIQSKFFKSRHKFEFRWWIPTTGILLILSDYLYFTAVGMEGTQISILSLIRRSGCVVGFLAGVIFYRDKNPAWKTVALGLILLGVFLLVMAK